MKFEKNFFLSQGDELLFEDRGDFESKCELLNLEISGRTEGRRSAHRERYTFFNHLKILNNNSILNFPFKVTKSDRPDFFVENDSKIGIEVTEATDQDYQAASTKLEAMTKQAPLNQRVPVIDISAYKPSNNNKDRYRGIREPGQVPKGEGWVANEVEEIWSHYIIGCMNQKLIDLNNQNKPYGFAEKYVLLIYDGTPTADLSIEDAIRKLKPRIESLRLQFAIFFDEMSIFRSHYLIYDITREGKVLKK